ncbi:protein crumbs homolog 3 [Passerculus sandwichensis]
MAGAPALALTLPCLALAQTSPSITSITSNGTAPQPGGGLSPAGVVALSVIFGGLGALALLGLLLLAALRLREKRRTEGSYRPSREEMGGGARAGGAPGPGPLRLPPEERLI